MHKVDIELGKDLFQANKTIADRVRKMLDEKGIKVIELMGSIGSGKTLIIEMLYKTT